MFDTPTLRHLATLGRAAGLVAKGVPGGFVLVMRSGIQEEVLTAQRGGPRTFRRLETGASYLKDLGIHSFEVDLGSWDSNSLF